MFAEGGLVKTAGTNSTQSGCRCILVDIKEVIELDAIARLWKTLSIVALKVCRLIAQP